MMPQPREGVFKYQTKKHGATRNDSDTNPSEGRQQGEGAGGRTRLGLAYHFM